MSDLPPLPFTNLVDENGLWDEQYGPYDKQQMIDYALSAICEKEKDIADLRKDSKAARYGWSDAVKQADALRDENLQLRSLLSECLKNTNLRNHPELTSLREAVTASLKNSKEQK